MVSPNKNHYWEKVLTTKVPWEFIQYIDTHYHKEWNKDIIIFLQHKFNVAVTTKQLRNYAHKFGMVKNIDDEQKSKLLIKRHNLDASATDIHNAILYIKKNFSDLPNGKIIKALYKKYKIVITSDQLSRNINRWLGLKKSPEVLANRHQYLIPPLKKLYKIKHNEFLKQLSHYPLSKTIIIASLLGDAELSPVPRGYTVFRDHHGSDQLEWLNFKSSFLPPEPYFKIRKYNDNSPVLVSQSNPYFSELEAHFYRQSTPEYNKNDKRKKREKFLDEEALHLCEETFSKNPCLALSILIGDDGALVSSCKKNKVYFSYIIYSQGFAKENGLALKDIIEKTTGLKLSQTKVNSEYGIRLTITRLKYIQQASEMITPYLSQIPSNNFKKKYDFDWHINNFSQKHNRSFSSGSPKNYWTSAELDIINDGIKNSLKPSEIFNKLLTAGYKRTYYGMYYKYREMLSKL